MAQATIEQDSGLKTAQVVSLRAQFGLNELPQPHPHPLALYLKNLWSPLAWLMEATMVLTFLSGRLAEGLVIALLLLVNSAISVYQRRSADAALAALRSNLQIIAHVLRDGLWQDIPTRELLPGDVIRVKVGDIVPADATLSEGNLSVDLSSLTGESLPRDLSADATLYSGSIVRHGEATASVTAIGKDTEFGKTTELLEVSHPPTHMERIILSIIRYFFVLNLTIALGVALFGWYVHAPVIEVTNFVVVLLLTSLPMAFPTMFAVAQTYGALRLSRHDGQNVLVRRLAAVQDAAMMDVLASDKTGTLTMNQLQVTATKAYSISEAELLGIAAASADPSGDGSIDSAIIAAAQARGSKLPRQLSFTPFDPATKRTEADITTGGRRLHITVGLPDLILDKSVVGHEQALIDVEALSAQGMRVVAVLSCDHHHTTCIGLVGLADPIRPDAPALIRELRELGIRVIMITGDGRATAAAVAARLGLKGDVITPTELKQNPGVATSSAVFAEVFPEDKLAIIKALQAAGHTVGMTGDGVNDAPALHQAEVGIAVYEASDVAKQSASFILTSPGLSGVIRAVKVSRGVYARLRTWALNKIVKSFEVSLFSTGIFLITHSFILSPLLAVFLLISNDFVIIAIATDHTTPVPFPAKWRVGRLMAAAAIIAMVPLIFMAITYAYVVTHGYTMVEARSIIYAALVFFGIATLYALRVWPHAWNVKPSKTLVFATIFSAVFTILVAGLGFYVAPVSVTALLVIMGLAILSFLAVDAVKQMAIVRRLMGF